MKLKVEPDINIEDGRHEGKIVEVKYRDDPFQYTDFIIEFEEGKRLKASYPTNVKPSSALARVISDFGFDVKVGSEVEPEWLIGKQCSFMTMRDGKFANVVKGSMRPL
jgi:hypothetical protein